MSETTTYTVTGMTCGHCEMSVREEVGEIPGVQDVQASHETGAVVVTSDGPLDRAAVAAAVEEAGYALA
ncbi:heavy-metal-associated domain-containing protein [Nocardioides pantholopis]|uniref:heavy-metal-associated domain-containing protein n=1 Tax=Nocardioides pantholopis TaxID=2483798 RepID=UPI000F0889D0|nr:heavy-metal-associated domain-containing protein [Nocardioides pantholopis]